MLHFLTWYLYNCCFFRKLFVGGINRQTTEEGLREYFSKFGEVSDCVLMKDKETQQSRGFGFVTYSNPQCVAEVLKARPHTVDNKIVRDFVLISY